MPGRVAIRQGGSAANTARWLARLGARSTLVLRGRARRRGRALVDALRARRRDGPRDPGRRATGPGRIGVLVCPAASARSSPTAGAADELRAGRPQAGLVRRPTSSTCRPTRSSASRSATAGRRAIELARERGRARQPRPRLGGAAAGPRPARGRAARRGRRAGPPVRDRGRGRGAPRRRRRRRAARVAPVAVVKRGAGGATVLARAGAPATAPVRRRDAGRSTATDTTAPATRSTPASSRLCLAAPPDARTRPGALHRAALAGHRAAARQLATGAAGAGPGMIADRLDARARREVARRAARAGGRSSPSSRR